MGNISTPITLLQLSDLDQKKCNWYVSGADVIVETIPQYLARVPINRRSPVGFVSILSPKEGYSPLPLYPYVTFKDELINFDCKLYQFIGGLADENFTEFITVDNQIRIAFDFITSDELFFVYNCPQAMILTSQEFEKSAATFDPPLNTPLAQYTKVTITVTEVGLIVVNGYTL